jgi:hypothetical protein
MHGATHIKKSICRLFPKSTLCSTVTDRRRRNMWPQSRRRASVVLTQSDAMFMTLV